MFDVAPTELMLAAVIALLVIGPKDLPKAMRFVGHWVGKARGMARHFRSGIDTMMRESELEEMERKWRAHNEEIMRKYPDIAQGVGHGGDPVIRGPDDPVIGPIMPHSEAPVEVAAEAAAHPAGEAPAAIAPTEKVARP